MSSKFLDKTGLDTLWAKIKSTFQTLGNLVTAWGSTPSDTKYPSEKLVKVSLDAKATKIEFTQPAEYKSFVIIEDVTRWYDPAGTAAISKGYQLIGQMAFWRSGGGYEGMAVAFIKFHLNYRWQLNNDSCCEIKSTLPNGSFRPMIIRDARDESNVKYYFGLRVSIAWASTVQFIGRTRDLSFSNLEWIPGENSAHTGNGTLFPEGITIERDCDLLEWNSIANGGTGATTAIGAEYNILNQVADIDTTISGDRKIALCNQTKSASNGVFRWLKLNNVWTWIKGLLSSEQGVNISGNAATATALSTGSDRTKLDGIEEGAEVNVQSDWNQTDTSADDYIKNKPQNLVQDASYVHTDNNYTTADKNKVDSAIQPGDSRLTRSVWSGGGTAVCGYKICTTYKIAGISGQASKIYAIVMGSMCLTNKYASQPQGSDSSGVDGALAMGSFMIWCEGNPDGTITARARLFSSDAAFNNDDIAICKKYVNGAVEWFVAFGPWDSSKAVTASRSFGMSVCFDYVQNASIPDTLETVPSGYGYEGYYSLWKHPYLQSTRQGAGSTTQPVYVTANGEVKTCKKLVQAVTSIDTSNMDPDVLYVM